MREKENYKTTKEKTNEKPIVIDNKTLSIEQILTRLEDLISKNQNPYSVSKEIEELKSIFYIKLKKEDKESQLESNISKKVENVKEKHPLEIKFRAFYDKYRKIKSDFRKNKEKEEKENLRIKRTIIQDIDLLSKEEESIKLTFEKFRTLQKKWKATGNVPITENSHIWQSYNHHVELFYDFIKINNDLRDLDFKRNLEEKIKICEKAEALLKEKSINKAHISLQGLHEHWKNVGPVERKQRESIWERFQEISKKINRKRNDYFTEKKKIYSLKLEEKNAISTLINDLSSEKIISHNQWQEANKRCNELENQWKSLGRLDKEKNKIAWNKLRSALKNFYTKRNTFYKEKKKNNKKILENKLAICKKAESIQHNTNWKETGKELIKLQEEWKNSEFLTGNESNQIWNRFRNACDIFFAARKAYYEKVKEEEKVISKKKESLIQKLKKFKILSNSKENMKDLNQFGLEWKKIGYNSSDKSNIDSQFLKLLNSKYEKIGLTGRALDKEKYKNKIISFNGNDIAIKNEKKFLKSRIDSLKKEIKQYENNISFFKAEETTKVLLKEVQKKIDLTNTNIVDLEKKIQMLNKA